MWETKNRKGVISFSLLLNEGRKGRRQRGGGESNRRDTKGPSELNGVDASEVVNVNLTPRLPNKKMMRKSSGGRERGGKDGGEGKKGRGGKRRRRGGRGPDLLELGGVSFEFVSDRKEFLPLNICEKKGGLRKEKGGGEETSAGKKRKTEVENVFFSALRKRYQNIAKLITNITYYNNIKHLFGKKTIAGTRRSTTAICSSIDHHPISTILDTYINIFFEGGNGPRGGIEE